MLWLTIIIFESMLSPYLTLPILILETTKNMQQLLYDQRQPFEAIFQFVKQITAFLEKLITWPRDLGLAIKNCQESFPSPM